MVAGIYKIENEINGKVYIGQSDDVKRRMKANWYSLQKNTHHNHLLQKDWNKYPHYAFKFAVIGICKKKDLDILEKKYISKYKATQKNYGYNIESGTNLYKKEITNNLIVLDDDKILKNTKNFFKKGVFNFSDTKNKKVRIIKNGKAPNGKQLYSIVYHSKKIKSSTKPEKLVKYLKEHYLDILKSEIV